MSEGRKTVSTSSDVKGIIDIQHSLCVLKDDDAH